MARTVEVDESLDPVAIPGRVLNELFAHCLETLPEECCGLIVGRAAGAPLATASAAGAARYERVVRCRNDMTQRHHRDPAQYPRSGREGFWMNEHDYLRAAEEAKGDGRTITAVYHSHVGALAYLSALDLEYAESPLFPFPEADHIVVPVFDRVVGTPAVFRRGGDGAFSGRAVVAAGP